MSRPLQSPVSFDRRAFLQMSGFGLGGIALAALLHEDGLLAQPIRPVIRPETPLVARQPHFDARAKRVLMIFCSGAVSHVDTFDYKPELVRLDGQPMPGANRLITFQGENGNLAAPRWRFRPRGQSGKMISDLLPNIAELADDLCFIHSMTARSNTHGPAENQMSTGFTLDGFPSMGAWVSYAARAASRATCPRVHRHSRSARRAAGGAEQLGQCIPPCCFSGHLIQFRSTNCEPGSTCRDQ